MLETLKNHAIHPEPINTEDVDSYFKLMSKFSGEKSLK